MDIPTYFNTALQATKRCFSHLWHHHCTLCAEPTDERICPDCEAYWPLQHHYCQRCSLPLAHHALFCGECLKQPPSFDHAYSPYLYERPLSDLIIAFKRQRNLTVGLALCSYWQKRIQQTYQNQHWQYPDYLAPVPTHWRKQWQRGFSHTLFMAEQLSHYFSIPLFKQTTMNYLKGDQKALSRQQRLRRLASAFRVKTTIEDQSIAIIDDVMTTGATANAFAKALRGAGARKVIVWSLARTAKHHLR